MSTFVPGRPRPHHEQMFHYMAADSDPDKARATSVSREKILQTDPEPQRRDGADARHLPFRRQHRGAANGQ